MLHSFLHYSNPPNDDQWTLRTNIAKPATAKERAAFNALAQVNKAQRNLSLTVGHSGGHDKADPRKVSSPEKQQPRISPKPSNPTKDGSSNDLQQ